MPSKMAVIVIITLLALEALSAKTAANQANLNDLLNIQEGSVEAQAKARLLQATFSNDNVVKECLDRVVTKANSVRTAKGVPQLNVNSNIEQKIAQWANNLRDSMSLTQYLQLFAINTINIETYESVPSESIESVVNELSTVLYDPNYFGMARYFNALDGRNYELILVFQGGQYGQKAVFTKEQIQNNIFKNSENTKTISQQAKTEPIVVPQKAIQVIKSVEIVPSLLVKQQVSTQIQVQIHPEVPAVQIPAVNTKPIITQAAPIINPIKIQDPKKIVNPNPTIISPIPVTVPQSTPSTPRSSQSIILTHGIPRTFLKGQYFPFRGYITDTNTNGITVSVIFTRISDQKRLAFTQTLPARATEFSILTNLNASGNFYLSIFAGVSSSTSSNIYTINSGFVGHIVSRPPAPIKEATSQLVGNDLLLNWTSSGLSQPALTQITLSQAGGRSAAFLISNYESSFLVPFSALSTFKQGIINIQISQAFSNNESASLRTSAFSAPFNLIFNTPKNRYAALTLSEISNVQSQVVSFLVSKFNLSGQSKPLSAWVRTYQNTANPIDFGVYMSGLGYDSAELARVSLEYNDGKFLEGLKASNIAAPSGSQKQVGVSVKYSKGNLDIFIVYA